MPQDCPNCDGSGVLFKPEELKQLRERKGKTLAEVAKRMRPKVSISYLCDIEHGKRGLSAAIQERYLKAIGAKKHV